MNDRPLDSSETLSENPYASPRPILAATAPNARSGRRPVVLTICGLLVLAVVLVFCQTGGHDFVNFDDDHYVYENEHINRGLTWDGLRYYSYHWHAYTYHPLSTFSHMLDCQLFGLEAGGHHWVNVGLHAITVVLLFLLLRQMTGRLWPSALVAALFAIHPLRVESVAWIAERKDVLSGLFFVLTLGAYVRYVRTSAAARSVGVPPASGSVGVPPAFPPSVGILSEFARSIGILPGSGGQYTGVCALYVLGLLAKPMLVTLPMVLLLLDYWPLRRWQAPEDDEEGGLKPTLPGEDEIDDLAGGEFAIGHAGGTPTLREDAGETSTLQRHIPWHLFSEKIPLLLLSLAACALTVHTQGAAIQSLESISCLARGANVLVAYVSYLGCFFWPQGLAILYPHPVNGFSTSMVCIAAAILTVVSAGVFLCRRRAPYLLVGWLWYLGMLVPVIGLLQVGGQKMADRYTYLPQIGLVWGLVWAFTDLIDLFTARGAGCQPAISAADWQSAPRWRFLWALSAAGIVAALAIGAWRQAAYWQDSETLWVRDLMYPNLVGHYNLGLALASDHRHEEAIRQFQLACAITPTDEDTLYSYAQSLEALGRMDEAVAKYRATLAVNEKSVNANDRLAKILASQGKAGEALSCWRRALQEDPKNTAIGKQIAELLAAKKSSVSHE